MNKTDWNKKLIENGRIMLAIEKYKNSEASLEKAAKIAGVFISKMMDILRAYKVEAHLEYEDYLTSLKILSKAWKNKH